MTVPNFIIILAIPIALILAVLFLAGQLIRRRMHAVTATGTDAPPNRLMDDLRGLEDALVGFFASSKVSSNTLSVLAAHRKPIRFKTLVHEVRLAGERRGTYEDMPMGAIRVVLSILQLARLARMSRAGFEITELGREVYRRIQPHIAPPAPPRMHSFASRITVSPNPRTNPAQLPSLRQLSLQPPREHLGERAHVTKSRAAIFLCHRNPDYVHRRNTSLGNPAPRNLHLSRDWC